MVHVEADERPSGSSALVRRNPYAERIAAEGIHVGRGRPTKGSETCPTVPCSVRFPAKLWEELEAKAKSQGLSLHSAVRTHMSMAE